MLSIRPVLVILASASLATALCGCGGGGADEIHPLARVAAAPVVRDAWDAQRTLLDGPAPEAPHEAEVRLYFRLRNEFDDPGRREEGAERFMAVWAADPANPLWVDLGLMKWSTLHGRPGALDLLSTAAGFDTTAAAHHFAYARQAWRKRANQDDPNLFVSAVNAADPGSMTWILASIRAARTQQAAGDMDGAMVRLAGLVDAAWRQGGPTLASNLWQVASMVLLRSGRLDDALLAGHAAEVCARADGSGYLFARSRIGLGRVHMERLEYDAARDTFLACRAVAVDSGYYRWAKEASALAARSARARGDVDGERAHLAVLHELATAATDTLVAIRAKISLGAAHRRRGAWEEAETWFAAAYAADDAWSRWSLRPSIDIARATLLDQRGRYAESESLFTVGAARLAGEAALATYTNLMRQGLETGRPDMAYRALATARRLDPGKMPLTAEYDGVLQLEAAAARFHARLGEYALADAALDRARQRAVEGSPVNAWYLAEAEGLVAREEGDPEAARSAFTTCSRLASELDNPDLERRSRIHLGSILVAQGKYAAAADLFAGDLDAPEYWPRLNAHLLVGMCRTRAGDPGAGERFLDEAERLLGPDAPRDLVTRLRLEQARVQVASGQAREAYVHLRQARAGLATETTTERTEIGRSFNGRIEQEIAEEALVLLWDHPELEPAPDRSTIAHGFAFGNPGAAAVPPGGARVEYFVGERRAFLWTRSAGTATPSWHDLGNAARLAELVEAVLVDMSYPGRAVDETAATALGRVLFGPVLDSWTPGSTLEIRPDGILDGLPWAACPLPVTGGAAALDRGPLILVTGGGAAVPRPAGSTALLVLGANGDPDPNGTSRLDRAEFEAASVAELWPGATDLRLGVNAGWQDLRDGGAAGFRAIHIASHARVYEGLEGHSTIHVAGLTGDAPLTIPEIHALGADAELVYLSSCEGARSHRAARHGVTSFAEAFLTGGADAVVASSVLVDDEAAAALARAFYRHWLRNGNRAAALRAALLEIRNADPRWEHPFYWSFTCLYRSGG